MSFEKVYIYTLYNAEGQEVIEANDLFDFRDMVWDYLSDRHPELSFDDMAAVWAVIHQGLPWLGFYMQRDLDWIEEEEEEEGYPPDSFFTLGLNPDNYH